VEADSNPIPMFVDVRDTVAGLKEQIFRSFTSDYMLEPHRIHLSCTNTNGGVIYVSTPFPLEMNPARYVPNDAEIKYFLYEHALVRFQVLPW